MVYILANNANVLLKPINWDTFGISPYNYMLTIEIVMNYTLRLSFSSVGSKDEGHRQEKLKTTQNLTLNMLFVGPDTYSDPHKVEKIFLFFRRIRAQNGAHCFICHSHH